MTAPALPPSPPAGASDHGAERGMLLMIVAMLTIPTTDAIAKWLSASLSPGEIACGRFFFQALLMAPMMIAVRRGIGDRLALQALRGALMAVAILCFFAALQVMPLADSIAIFFVEPLVLTLMSAVFLGEHIGWRRLLAVLVGFAGALLVIRPSYGIFGPHALLPLATAVSFAAYLVMTKRLVAGVDPFVLQFNASLFAGLVVAAALGVGALADIPVLALSWPTPFEWLMLVVLGAVAGGLHLVIVHAMRLAPAGLLAPFQYLEIIGATSLGWFLFGDFPGPWVWAGMVLIVGSGLYVFHRERVVREG